MIEYSLRMKEHIFLEISMHISAETVMDMKAYMEDMVMGLEIQKDQRY